MQSTISQNQLLDRIRSGDRKAIQDLYKDAFGYCASFILKNKGSREDASEIFQRSMVVLLEKLQDDQFTIQHTIKTYLYSINRNQWLTELKRKGKTVAIISEEGKEIPLVSEDNREEQEAKENQYTQMFEAMKEASEECQKVLKLTFFKKKKDKEIAPIMGYTPEFVRNKRRRCIASLRKKLVA